MLIRLTDRQDKFLKEYLANGRNSSAAYKASYDCTGLTEQQVVNRASNIVSHSRVTTALAQLQEKILEDLTFTAKDVFEQWVRLATGDVNELVQHRRLCCRWCHGDGHAYQWKDDAEFAQARAEAMDAHAMKVGRAQALKLDEPELSMPTDEGGYGFRFNAVPHQRCPRCFGEGYGDIFIADTRYLSASGLALYDGVKKTKDGIELKIRDRTKPLSDIAKFLGMLRDTGQPGNFIIPGQAAQIDNPIPDEPMAALAFYRDIASGS